MKSSQMSASLNAYALLLDEVGCSRGARDLENLAAVFDKGHDQTVPAVVKKIDKRWKASRRPAEHPGPLKAQLVHIASALKAAGAASVAKDYGLIVSLLGGPDGMSSRAFAEAAIRALDTEHAPPTEPAQPPDLALVSAFAEKLTAASADNAKFDAVVSELKVPRKFSNAALAAIANRYLGGERTYDSKSEILKAIINRQLQDAIQGSRDRRIAKIAV